MGPLFDAAKPCEIGQRLRKVECDWLQGISVTQPEIEIFEAFFGDFFDGLFGP
jgi:hypothetical protein